MLQQQRKATMSAVKNRGIFRAVFFWVPSFAVLGAAFTGPGRCDDGETFGYADFETLKSDIADLDNVNQTTFTICPNTNFSDISGPLRVGASNDTIIQCPSKSCVFSGGEIQLIAESTLHVRGIIFEGATETSTILYPLPQSNITFEDCLWKNSRGDVVFLIQDPPERRIRKLQEEAAEESVMIPSPSVTFLNSSFVVSYIGLCCQNVYFFSWMGPNCILIEQYRRGRRHNTRSARGAPEYHQDRVRGQ